MAPLQLLIVEGNSAERNGQIRAQGGRVYADVYAAVLKAIAPAAEFCVAQPSETDPPDLLRQIDLEGLDGVVWTGSSLNAYDGGVAVRRQIDLFGELYDARLPIFGSCWGLQVMAVARGGVVRRNPRGREIGIARDIELTPAGTAHPMFQGKLAKFDSITTHVDEVERLPSGAVALAGNAASAIQAAVLEDDGRSFWGVQYHPEFDFEVLAQVLRRASRDLVAEGMFSSPDALERVCRSLLEVDAGSGQGDLARSTLGVSDGVADPAVRRLEIKNWIDQVNTRRRAPGSAPTPG